MSATCSARRWSNPNPKEHNFWKPCAADEELRTEVEQLLTANQEPSWQSSVAALFALASKLTAGERLAQYRIEELLREGGMGVVYRAYDTATASPGGAQGAPARVLGGSGT